jgi:hypothetical protein
LACRGLASRQLLDARRIHPLERVAHPDAGDDAVGRDLGKRHENEGALEQMRVGQRQGGVVEDQIVISQEIEIDGSRSPVLFFAAVAAEGAFAGLGASQQRVRRKRRRNRNDGIDERRLVGNAPGWCPIIGRSRRDPHAAAIAHDRYRLIEGRPNVAHIAAQRDERLGQSLSPCRALAARAR